MNEVYKATLSLVFVACCTVLIANHPIMSEMMHSCFINCKVPSNACEYWTFHLAGEAKKLKMKSSCVLNLWNISHIVLYAVMAFVFPQYSMWLFLIGCIWELLEYCIGHHNPLDIIWNAVGIVLGLTSRKVFSKMFL